MTIQTYKLKNVPYFVYDIGAIELYQHIKNGLNIYPKDFSTVMLADHVQPLSKYDIGFEIEYDMANSDEVYISSKIIILKFVILRNT